MSFLKKNERKVNNKNSHTYLICGLVVCICVVFLSIGFASFSNDLSIKGISATVRIREDIRINSIVVKEASKDVTASYLEYNVKNTSTGVTLPHSDSYIVLDVGIINLGNTEMGIASIIGSSDKLKYEVVNDKYTSSGVRSYKLNEKLCDDVDSSKCKLGSESHVLVKVSYKNAESYNSSSVDYNVNISYDFKRVLNIEYSTKALELLLGDKISYILENQNVSIGIKANTVNDFDITSSYILNKNVDYVFENNVLTIKNVMDDIVIDASPNFDNNEEVGIRVSAEFIDDRDVIITLNGSNPSDAIFIKVSPNDVKVTNDSSTFYDQKFVGTGALIYKKNEPMYISYEYIEGDVTLAPFGKAFTVKYRDTTTKCAGINAAPELVTNHTKNQFNILETGLSTGNLTKDAVDFISVYADVGYTFNNFKFRVRYGRQSDL